MLRTLDSSAPCCFATMGLRPASQDLAARGLRPLALPRLALLAVPAARELASRRQATRVLITSVMAHYEVCAVGVGQSVQYAVRDGQKRELACGAGQRVTSLRV